MLLQARPQATNEAFLQALKPVRHNSFAPWHDMAWPKSRNRRAGSDKPDAAQWLTWTRNAVLVHVVNPKGHLARRMSLPKGSTSCSRSRVQRATRVSAAQACVEMRHSDQGTAHQFLKDSNRSQTGETSAESHFRVLKMSESGSGRNVCPRGALLDGRIDQPAGDNQLLG